MSENDEWVQAALTDNAIVADLLLRLRQAPLPSPSKRKGKAPAVSTCPRWTVRQQRSKQVIKKKEGESPFRASPTTPLSWSEATSVSGGAAEDSCRFGKVINSARSEFLPAATSEGHFNKRGRKRKQTVDELRAAESSLLNESIILKSKVAMLRSDVEKARTVNASLKRMKVDALSRHMMETFTAAAASKQAALNESQQPVVLAYDPIYSISQGVMCSKLDQCLPNCSSDGLREPSSLIPDLNLPVDKSGFLV